MFLLPAPFFGEPNCIATFKTFVPAQADRCQLVEYFWIQTVGFLLIIVPAAAGLPCNACFYGGLLLKS